MFSLYLLASVTVSGISGMLNLPSKQEGSSSTDLSSIISRLTLLERTVADYQAKTSELESELQAAKTTIEDQKQRCTSEISSLKNELALKTQDIAFNVYLSSETMQDVIKAGDPIPFWGITYNSGNSYNRTSSKFTAPVSGTYIFSTTVDVSKQDTAQSTAAQIMKSGVDIVMSKIHTTDVNSETSSTATAISYVKQGEEVWVELLYDAKLWGNDYQQTIFVGALLAVH